MFHNNVAWKKKTTASRFDVTMCCHDDAEVYKLVGTFVLSKLGNIIFKMNTGLYRDDVVVVVTSMNAERIDKIRKIIITMSQKVGLQLEIKANLNK